MVNGWTFEETIKTTKNLMETESNMFKWDVLRHLRDFAENFKDRIQQFEAIGTIEEFKDLKEKNTPLEHHHTRIDDINDKVRVSVCPSCLSIIFTHSEEYPNFCVACGQKLDWSE